MRFRIPFVIPVALLTLSLCFSVILFIGSLKHEEETIRKNALDWMNRDISRLQNILYNRLTENNYTEARLNISVTAMNSSIKTILLTDDNHKILLANRYLLEGLSANTVIRYEKSTANSVTKSSQPAVFYHDTHDEILNGYYPVILKLESKQGLPIKRTGVLFVESSITTPLAYAKQIAINQALAFTGVMIVASILFSLILHLWLSRRLLKLTAASRTFSSGNLDVKANISGNDELSELGKSFDEMVDRIKNDILLREKVENELRLLNETLEQHIDERTSLLREAQHVAKMGYLNWNIKDNVLEWSDEIYQLFDYQPAEIQPSMEALYSLLDPRDALIAKQIQKEIFEGKDCKCDFRIQTKKGNLRWIHSRIVAVTDEQKQVVAARGIMQDITELKVEMENRETLEKQLLQSQKMESLGQLTGGIAHDFNNILASIVGFTSLLKRLDINDPKGKTKEYLEQISEASNRGKNLVQQMLAFGRTKDGIRDKEFVEVEELVKGTLSLLRPIMPSSISLDLDTDGKNPVVAADPDMLGQVITNLCLNARDSLPASQGHIRIYYGWVRINDRVCSSCHHTFSDNYAEITVEDNGHGITEESINRVFEPFYTTKVVNKGSGMGLPIVHGIVHKHNGHIIVESTPGQGSRFRCFFPAIESIKLQAEHTRGNIAEEIEPGNGQHILVIDDEAPLTFLLKELLTQSGYRITAMTDSQQALEYFRGFYKQIDLVITDQTMPELTGLQLAQEMLSIDDSKPVIICTGFSESITNETLRQKNIVEILQKPLDDEKLQKKIKYILTSKQKNKSEKH